MKHPICTLTKLALLSGAIAVMTAAVPAFGQNDLCIQDAYNSFNGLTAHPKTLSCTANDVSISKVTGVSIIRPDGTIDPSDKCVSSTTFNFIADFTIQTTSNKTRSNIGLFFGTGASNLANLQALTGTCSDSILTPLYTPAGASYQLGDATYEELDQAINGETSPTGCGDTSSTDNNGAGTQFAELEVDSVVCPLNALDPCPDPTINGTCMALPECTGWYQPTTTMPVCDSPTHAWVPTAVPGTTSKCNCTTLYIPVQLIQPSASIAKTCTTDPTNSPTDTTCDLGAEGGNEVYQVKITNTTPANEGDIAVDQICDNQYGTIYDNLVAPNRCPAGSLSSSLISTTCGSGTVGDIANGSFATCTFTVSHGENLSVTDDVTIAGQSTLATTQTFNAGPSNTVTVTSSDAPSTATTTKGLAPGPIQACLTLRYNVTVANTSGADETLTLNSSVGTPALLDSYFGDITSDHGSASVGGSVTGTTCGIAPASPGLGSLSGSPGAGTFPATLATSGGSYTCQFDGVICGAPGPIPADGSICKEGLSNKDTVTANLTGDDPAPNADTISETANPFTATVCLVQQ